MDGTIFVDCKLHGVSGTPRRTEGVTFERPDLSAGGDGRTIGNAADVMALLRGEVVDLI
jgi:hypothetical protein